MFPGTSKISGKWGKWLLVCLLVAILPAPGMGQAKFAYPNQPPPPPEPYPVNVEVARGQAVWIKLSAYSLTSPIGRFRIKRPPKGGKLGTPQFVPPDSGLVRYEPPAGYGPGEDDFSYTVQSDAGVSAPADVHIKVTDTDPVFLAPSDIEFGDVLAGQSATKALQLQNIGGGLAEGTVQVPVGWSVEGDASYHLTRGQTQNFNITFTPTKEGTFTGDIAYTGNPERATDLNGREVAPLGLPEGTVELGQAGGGRLGTIHVENRTGTTQELKLTAGAHVETDGTAEAPAKGAVDIVVRATGDDGEFQDRVTVEGAGMMADVTVHAPALVIATAEAASTPSATPSATPTRTEEAGNGAGGAESSAPGLPPPGEESEEGMQTGDMIMALGVGNVSQNEAEVSANFKGAPAARSYRVEFQTVALDAQGMPVAQWTPYPDATMTVNGQSASAQVQHLAPGQMYVMRLVGLDGNGAVIERTAASGVWTAQPGRRWTWQWALVAAAGFGGVWIWRRWRASNTRRGYR